MARSTRTKTEVALSEAQALLTAIVDLPKFAEMNADNTNLTDVAIQLMKMVNQVKEISRTIDILQLD